MLLTSSLPLNTPTKPQCDSYWLKAEGLKDPRTGLPLLTEHRACSMPISASCTTKRSVIGETSERIFLEKSNISRLKVPRIHSFAMP
jgi:hypothetical protein